MEDQEEKSTKRKPKYCKHCHAEMERHTNRCPSCGKKQWHPLPWTILAIFVAAVILGAIFSNTSIGTTAEPTEEVTEEVAETETPNQEEITDDASDEQKTEETAGEPAEELVEEPAEETDDYIYVGETFTVNGLEITFDSYNDNYTDYTNDYWWYPPDDGYKYVTATFTYKNTQSSGDRYISIYDFDCYADNELMAQAYVVDTGDFMRGNLSAGRTKTIPVAFAVPINSESIELEYTNDGFSRSEYIIKCK